MEDFLEINVRNYESRYGSGRVNLRYPADWIIRFHHLYMKEKLPKGRILDFGLGSGNNARFFRDAGYDVHGTDVAHAVLPLVEENLGDLHNIEILSPDIKQLSYADEYFDMILSNQVLYYLADKERIRLICEEFRRILKPNGVVFFTMLGAKNYYISDKENNELVDNDIYRIRFEDAHRLSGYHQVIYVIRDELHLRDVFDMFECISIGYFDQSMLTLPSNFHWIFIGKKHPD